jgi:DnaJ family protein A protein 2
MVYDTTLYDRLQVQPTCTNEELKKSWKKLVLKHHPDKNGGSDEEFKKIDHAYKILSDPNSKQAYDSGGLDALNVNNSVPDMSSLFNMFFNPFGQNAPQLRTPDIIYKIQEPFNTFYYGLEKTINVARLTICKHCKGIGGEKAVCCTTCKGSGIQMSQIRQGPMIIQSTTNCNTCQRKGTIIINKCTTCNGNCVVSIVESLKVTISRGIKQGHVLIIKGKANEQPKAVTGDLRIIVTSLDDKKLIVDDNGNIYITLDIPLYIALVGGKIDIPHPNDNDIIPIEFPKGKVTKYGEELIIKSEGMFRGKDSKGNELFANLHVKFNIVLPCNEWAKKVNAEAVITLLE